MPATIKRCKVKGRPAYMANGKTYFGRFARVKAERTIFNVYCPTGKGGGIDPTCSYGGSLFPIIPTKSAATLVLGLKDDQEIIKTANIYHHGFSEPVSMLSPKQDQASDHLQTHTILDSAVKTVGAIDVGRRLQNAGVTKLQVVKFVEEANGKYQDYEEAVSHDSVRNDPFGQAASIAFSAWADSSDGRNKVSVAMQLCTKRLFGLRSAYEPNKGYSVLGVEFADKHRLVIDALIKSIYDRTQDRLKAAKVERLTLYRGMGLPLGSLLGMSVTEKSSQTIKKTLDTAMVKLQSLSSFSSSFKVASDFSYTSHTDHAVDMAVLAINVDRRHLFAVPGTGFGCVYENEFVVLGGEYQAKVAVRNRGTAPDKSTFWKG